MEVCRITIISICPSPKWQNGARPFGERDDAHEMFAPATIKYFPRTVFQFWWSFVPDSSVPGVTADDKFDDKIE